MVVRWRKGPYSFAEFLELIPCDQKADLIDGVIYPMSPENVVHNKLIAWLLIVMQQFMEDRQLGSVTINRVAYRLAPETAPEPDLAVVLAERTGIIRSGYVDGPPDLAVEVVSPESAERDYELKRQRYELFGVNEYWIIDPDEQSTVFWSRDLSTGQFVEMPLEGTVFRSKVLKGFYLDTSWLWQRPLPPTVPVVKRLLQQGS